VRRALRRHLLVLLFMAPICCGAVGTTLLDAWAAALVFTGLAVALHAGGAALRAFTDGRHEGAGPPAIQTSEERRST